MISRERLSPVCLVLRFPIQKYFPWGECVESSQHPSGDPQFATYKPTPESLELGGVKTVSVVEDDEGRELQHVLTISDSERLNDIERPIGGARLSVDVFDVWRH